MRSPRFWVSGYCTKWRTRYFSFHSWSSRSFTSRLSKEIKYLASILTDTPVECTFRNMRWAQERSLHTRRNLISISTMLHGRGDERWPMETRDTCRSSSIQKFKRMKVIFMVNHVVGMWYSFSIVFCPYKCYHMPQSYPISLHVFCYSSLSKSCILFWAEPRQYFVSYWRSPTNALKMVKDLPRNEVPPTLQSLVRRKDSVPESVR